MNHVCSPPNGGGGGLLNGPSTQQSDRQHIGVVKVSAVLVDVTPELVEEPVPTGSTGYDGDTEYMSPQVWQTVLGSGRSVREEAATGVDCCDSVVGGPTHRCRLKGQNTTKNIYIYTHQKPPKRKTRPTRADERPNTITQKSQRRPREC